MATAMPRDVAEALKPRTVDTALASKPPAGPPTASLWRARGFAMPMLGGSLNDFASRSGGEKREIHVSLTTEAATQIFGVRGPDGQRHANLNAVKFAGLSTVSVLNSGPVPLALSFSVAKGNLYGPDGTRASVHAIGGVDNIPHDIISHSADVDLAVVAPRQKFPGYTCNNLLKHGVTPVGTDGTHVLVSPDHPVIALAKHGLLIHASHGGDPDKANMYGEILDAGKGLNYSQYPMSIETLRVGAERASVLLQKDMTVHDFVDQPLTMTVRRLDGLPFDSPVNVPGGAAALNAPFALNVRLAGEFAAAPTEKHAEYHGGGAVLSAAATPVHSHSHTHGQ